MKIEQQNQARKGQKVDKKLVDLAWTRKFYLYST